MTDSPVTIRLRELERSDLPQLNFWRNDKGLIDLLGNNFLFISSAIDERWFDDYLHSRDQAVRLAIIVEQTGQYIGNVNLTSIHRVNRSAEFSILVGDRHHWGKGIGQAASRLMLAHAFDDLNLHRVYLSVIKDNHRAIHVYKKVGFSEEGCQRHAIFKDGLYCDLVIMSILRDEFQADTTKAPVETIT
jgi:RimJ/RimL family protein N-acetyltransferase